MKQTKHIWWTFSPWEADALRQYLEQLALEGLVSGMHWHNRHEVPPG